MYEFADFARELASQFAGVARAHYQGCASRGTRSVIRAAACRQQDVSGRGVSPRRRERGSALSAKTTCRRRSTRSTRSRARPISRSEWHFIGPIQSNKTRAIAERFDWVQSVDRLKIAERLSEQRPADLPPLNVLLQVNVSGEASKGGVAPDELVELAAAVARLPRLRLRGLMAIPAPEDDVARQRHRFCAMPHALFRQLREQGLEVDVLSMGMSDDLEAAIAEGSTMVRVGTAIFGARADDIDEGRVHRRRQHGRRADRRHAAGGIQRG